VFVAGKLKKPTLIFHRWPRCKTFKGDIGELLKGKILQKKTFLLTKNWLILKENISRKKGGSHLPLRNQLNEK
jgi:hypothetical protein